MQIWNFLSTKPVDLTQFAIFLFHEDQKRIIFTPTDVLDLLQKIHHNHNIKSDPLLKEILATLNAWKDPVPLLHVVTWMREHREALLKPVEAMHYSLSNALLGKQFWTQMTHKRYGTLNHCEPYYVINEARKVDERYKKFRIVAVNKSEKLRQKRIDEIHEKLNNSSLIKFKMPASFKYATTGGRGAAKKTEVVPLDDNDDDLMIPPRLPEEKRPRRNIIRPNSHIISADGDKIHDGPTSSPEDTLHVYVTSVASRHGIHKDHTHQDRNQTQNQSHYASDDHPHPHHQHHHVPSAEHHRPHSPQSPRAEKHELTSIEPNKHRYHSPYAGISLICVNSDESVLHLPIIILNISLLLL